MLNLYCYWCFIIIFVYHIFINGSTLFCLRFRLEDILKVTDDTGDSWCRCIDIIGCVDRMLLLSLSLFMSVMSLSMWSLLCINKERVYRLGNQFLRYFSKYFHHWFECSLILRYRTSFFRWCCWSRLLL